MATTKKIGIGTMILTITSLILWAIMRPDILVESSGDMVCKGTYKEPCESFINVTSLEKTIYFYNPEQFELTFSPEIKDYRFCKKDGRIKKPETHKGCGAGWRPLNLSQPFYYKYKYVLRWNKGEKNQYKLVGYKNNPRDTIKWGVSTNGADLDPIWYGAEFGVINRGVNFDVFQVDKNKLRKEIYMGAVNIPDENGTYHPFEEYIDVTVGGGQVTFSRGETYSVSFMPIFIMENNNTYSWADIPSSIEKNLWKKTYRGKHKYGVDFNNVPDSIKNNLKYVVLHKTGSTGLTWDDIKIRNKSIIIKDKIKLSHDDILRDYTIPIINKSDIYIGNLTDNFVANADGTWNITFDPSASYDFAIQTNVAAWSDRCDDPPLPDNYVPSSCNNFVLETANAGLDSDDGSYAQKSVTILEESYFGFNFTIQEKIGEITNFNFTWDGKVNNVAPATRVKIYTYVWNQTQWGSCSIILDTAADAYRNCTLNGNLEVYLDDDNVISFITYGTNLNPSVQGTMYIDYAKLTLDYLVESPINTTLLDATDEPSMSPNIVLINDTHGYAFYSAFQGSGDLVCVGTTDKGFTWDVDCGTISTRGAHFNPSVWYDRWTRGDNGDSIHILTPDTTTDDNWYFEFNTSTNTFSAGVVAIDFTALLATDGATSITKSTKGDLFVMGPATTMEVATSSDGVTWNDITPKWLFDNDDDHGQLLPLPYGDVFLIYNDISSTKIYWAIWNHSASEWQHNQTELDDLTQMDEEPRHNAIVNPITNDIYLVADERAGYASPTNARIYHFNATTFSFTNILNQSLGIESQQEAFALDLNTEDIYLVFTNGTADGANDVYYRKSTDNAHSFGTADKLSELYGNDDIRWVKTNMMSNERLYTNWYNDDDQHLLGRTVASFDDTTSPIITLNSPTDDDNNVDFTSVTFNCTADDFGYDLINISLYSDFNGTWKLINTTVISNGSYTLVETYDIEEMKTYFIDDTIKWNCLAYDKAGRSAFATSNFTFSDWDLGNYTNTSANYKGLILKLNNSYYDNLTGTYISQAFNNGTDVSVNWNNLEWNYTLESATPPVDTTILYHFNGTDGATGITDVSGNANHGTSSGAFIETNNSNFGGSSLYCDGVDDYVTTTSRLTFDTNWTIDFWAYFNAIDNYDAMIGSKYDNEPAEGWFFRYYYIGEIQFHMRDVISSTLSTTNADVTAGNWYHLAVESNVSHLLIYVNGTQKASVARAGAYDDSGTEDWLCRYYSIAGEDKSYYFDGYIDEFRFSDVTRYNGNFIPPKCEYYKACNVSLSVRTSDDTNTWSNWLYVTNPSGLINASAEYLQYKAEFTTSNNLATPILNWVNISYIAAVAPPPADTCTYTSGDWEVDCGDDCVVDSTTDLDGNNIWLDNQGKFIVESEIINVKNITISDLCNITYKEGFNITFLDN